MSRPSRHMDRHLLDAGKRLALANGLSGLSIRQVSEAAGVNPGMFHYHFKTKEQFAARLLSEVYETMFLRLKEEFEHEAGTRDPLDRLRALLLVMARVSLDNREIFALIVKEALVCEPTVLAFIKANFPRHLALLAKAIADCQAKNQLRRDLSVPQILVICASTLNTPVVFGTALGEALELTAALNTELFSSDFVEARLNFLLKGLSA